MKIARVDLNVEQKLEILKKLASGVKIKDITNEFKISARTVYRIKTGEESLEALKLKTHKKLKVIKRERPSRVPNVDKAVYTWFLKERSLYNNVSDRDLQVKALEFNQELDTDQKFEASNGWLHKFKMRHGIRLLKVCGEKLSANESAVPDFLEKFKEDILAMDLRPEQIYNADETGLVYKDLSNKTLVLASEKSAPGRKNSKQRITVMPCVNATGRHKLPLMIIGKSKAPRCFKNCVLPDVHYRSSKNAWQTQRLFLEWFETVFIPKVKINLVSQGLPEKAILLLDNATCHNAPEIMAFKSSGFIVIFFPPNTTSIIQPLDQQIIFSMKTSYRKLLLLHLLKQDGNTTDKLKNLSLRDVLFIVEEAWQGVTERVIINGFKCLFKDIENFDLNLGDDHFNRPEDDVPLVQLYRNVANGSNLNDEEIRDWAGGVNEIERNPELAVTDDEIIQDISREEADPDPPNNHHSLDEVVASFNKVVDWAMTEDIDLSDLYVLRKLANKAMVEKLNQTNSNL